jgi:hypothetical protein
MSIPAMLQLPIRKIGFFSQATTLRTLPSHRPWTFGSRYNCGRNSALTRR